MLELVAQGSDLRQRWRAVLRTGPPVLLGRDHSAGLVIPWDPLISRRHLQLQVRLREVEIHRLASAANPLFYEGQSVDHCVLTPGRHFVLGTTTFRLHEAVPEAVLAPIEDRTFNAQQLEQIRFQDPENRLDVLAHLPDVIAGTQSDRELWSRLTALLLRGVVHADTVAIVGLAGSEAVAVRHAERRWQSASEFRPSRRLVCDALEVRRQSVLHVWNAPDAVATSQPTLSGDCDWAFCSPVDGFADSPTGLYVAGRMGPTYIPGTTLSDGAQLEADVKFTELVAKIISAVLRSRQLERQKTGLRQFFAPPILAALGDNLDTSLLEPCECEVAVMFCDLRGFSQRAEREVANLIGLLERVSRALGVMTQEILRQGGVTGDFQGDAALGFWGWPFPSPNAAVQACRAALAIRAAFMRTATQRDHPLADFSMGIGIALGRAVAGKIGTAEQVKVTVFGPVVNLAHRLEGMTKVLRAPILLDESTAAIVRTRMPLDDGRVRRLAKVLPVGMERPLMVNELLPAVADLPELTDGHLFQFEQGVDHFLLGQWDDAYRCLHGMPASDRAQDFLLHQITQAGRTAPAGWDGVIRLEKK